MDQPLTPAPAEPLTPPAEATVDEVTPPVTEGRTLWSSIAGTLSAVAGGCTAMAGVLSAEPWKTRLIIAGGALLVLSQVAANLGSVFSKTAGVRAAARALEIMRGQR